MKNPTRTIWIATILTIAGIIIAGVAVSYLAEKQPHRGIAMEDLAVQFQPEAKQLGGVIIKNYREFRGNTVRWSAAYFGCLFGSAFLSAMAALFLKLEVLGDQPKLRNDLAASFATVAALLVTLSTTGDFQRKWHANRMAAAAMENLAYDLVRPSAATNLDAILTRVQEINDLRNRGIGGELTGIESKEPPVSSAPVQTDS